MDQIFVNGIILNATGGEPLKPGKRKMFGVSGWWSQGLLLLQVSVMSELGVDASSSSILSGISFSNISTSAPASSVSGILYKVRPAEYFPCLLTQLWVY